MLKEVLPLSRLHKPDFWMYEYQINKVFVFLSYDIDSVIQKYLFTMVLGVNLDLNSWPLKTSAATYTTVSWRRP